MIYVKRRVSPSSGPGTFANLTRERRPVDSQYQDAPDPVRRGAFTGIGRAPSKTMAYYDVAYFQHADAPWASDMEGRPGQGPLQKWAYEAYHPAVQDSRTAAGSQNPYVDRINLKNPDRSSYGAAVDQATGGEYVYMPGVA